jgi:hypothetical protein
MEERSCMKLLFDQTQFTGSFVPVIVLIDSSFTTRNENAGGLVAPLHRHLRSDPSGGLQ